MITDLDKRLMNINGDDHDLIDLDDPVKGAPSLYNMKKEIKIDSNNMGIKSYNDNVKKQKRIKDDIETKLNPLGNMYPCLKRQKVEI